MEVAADENPAAIMDAGGGKSPERTAHLGVLPEPIPEPGPAGPPASAPVGRPGAPITIEPGTNSPAAIENRLYFGHALDRMQERGIPPSVVDDTIANGQANPGNTPGTTTYYSATNNVTVVKSNTTGRIVTVRKGTP